MTDQVWQRNEIASPCTRVCVIHRETGFCTGCLRTLDEIGAWGSFTDAERAEIMEKLPSRRGVLSQRRGGRAGRIERNGSGRGPSNRT